MATRKSAHAPRVQDQMQNQCKTWSPHPLAPIHISFTSVQRESRLIPIMLQVATCTICTRSSRDRLLLYYWITFPLFSPGVGWGSCCLALDFATCYSISPSITKSKDLLFEINKTKLRAGCMQPSGYQLASLWSYRSCIENWFQESITLPQPYDCMAEQWFECSSHRANLNSLFFGQQHLAMKQCMSITSHIISFQMALKTLQTFQKKIYCWAFL